MKRYSNYEFISARWYNQIPIHWHLIRIKDLISQSNAGAWGDDPETDNGTICLRVADMDFNLGVFKNKPVSVLTKRLYTEEQIEKLTLEQGDILIEKSGGGEKSPVGRSVYFDKSYPALFANFMQKIRFKHKLIDAHFASYLLRTMYYRGATWYYVKQTTGIQNLDLNSMLAQERFPVPPREEQDQIVRYLDWQVSKINRLIAAKKKQIQLLLAKKHAVAADYVTHGLRPNVAVKDSGVNWLGTIPAHWSIRKLRTLLKPFSEKNRPDLPLLSVVREKGVIVRDVEDTENNHNFIPDDLSGYKVVHENQFVINKMKAWQGSYGIAPCDGIVSPAYFIFDIDFENLVYFHYAIRSKVYVNFFAQASDGIRVGQWDLSINKMKNIPFIVPPAAEQDEIVSYIKAETASIEKAITTIEKQIDTLEDLRTRLISDVVTGQVDVRGIKVPDDEYINNEITEEEFEEESENNEEE